MKINREMKRKLWFAAKYFENIDIKIYYNALKQDPKLKYIASILTGDGKN